MKLINDELLQQLPIRRVEHPAHLIEITIGRATRIRPLGDSPVQAIIVIFCPRLLAVLHPNEPVPCIPGVGDGDHSLERQRADDNLPRPQIAVGIIGQRPRGAVDLLFDQFVDAVVLAFFDGVNKWELSLFIYPQSFVQTYPRRHKPSTIKSRPPQRRLLMEPRATARQRLCEQGVAP